LLDRTLDLSFIYRLSYSELSAAYALKISTSSNIGIFSICAIVDYIASLVYHSLSISTYVNHYIYELEYVRLFLFLLVITVLYASNVIKNSFSVSSEYHVVTN